MTPDQQLAAGLALRATRRVLRDLLPRLEPGDAANVRELLRMIAAATEDTATNDTAEPVANKQRLPF